MFCFEEDHPVTDELDEDFKRVVCRNCHRKTEADRDIKGLTKNGQHEVVESDNEKLRRYLLLMAEDEESQAELLQSAPDTPIKSNYCSVPSESGFASPQGARVIIVQPARCQ